MRSNDSQLQRCGESNLTASVNARTEVRELGVLLAVHETFQMLEGPHPACVHETIKPLFLPDTRPALRRWDRPVRGDLHTVAVTLRDNLNPLAGERLEVVEDNPHNQN